MDLRYTREVTVGFIVIVAVTAFILGTMWLSGRSVSGDLTRIRFADVSGLKRASPVRISGVPVGRVERIELARDGGVLVSISLPEEIRPKIDAAAEIAAISLVGDYAVDFDPGDAAQPLPEDRVILGRRKVELSDRAQALGDRADSLLLGAQAIVNQRTADQLYATMEALQGTLRAARRTMEVFADTRTGPTAELTRTMATLRQLTARLDTTLANPSLQRALQRTDTLTANLASMTTQFTATGRRLDSLLTAVQSGRGTFGALVRDSTLYWNMVGTTASLDSLLTELKRHPGKIGVTVKLF